MNDSLEVLKKIYKPYKYTLKNKVVILNTTSGDFVVKEKNSNIKNIFDYLKSRNFINYPNLIDESRTDVNVFEYIKDTKMPKEQKAQDLINIIANLHSKTTYFKVVSDDTFKSVYDSIKSNIDYLENYYEALIENIKKEEYMSPSNYLIIRNSSKIFEALSFCSDELDKWLNMVKEEKKQRVCLIHNNLSLNHFIKGDKECLISWDKSKIDTPILDLITLYKNNYFDLDFETLFSMYQNKYPLSESEKKLLFIVISLPKKIEIKEENEFKKCVSIRTSLDYLFKTEELIRPYYTVKKPDQKNNFNK